MMGSVEIRSGDGFVLVGPPGMFPPAARAAARPFTVAQRLFGNPRAVSRLRWQWPQLGLGGDQRFVSDADLRLTFEQAVRQGRLVALYVQQRGQSEPPFAVAAAKPAAPVAAGGVRPVSTWSRGEKIEAALRRSADHVGPELRKLLDQLLSVETIAIMIAFCIAVVLAQLGGVSAAAIDAALLAIAYACAGFAGIQAVYEFIAATVGASEAKTEADINAAAQRFAYSFTKLGEAFLAWLLARMQAKKGGGAKPAEPAAAKPAVPKAAAEPAPAPARRVVPAPKVPGNVYRGDGRPPGTIFKEGFQPRGTSTDLNQYVLKNSESAFVGTSKSADQAIAFAKANNGYVYQIDQVGLKGIDVNKAFPGNPYASELEVAFPGGVPREAIISARQVLPNGGLGSTIPNPFYKGGP